MQNDFGATRSLNTYHATLSANCCACTKRASAHNSSCPTQCHDDHRHTTNSKQPSKASKQIANKNSALGGVLESLMWMDGWLAPAPPQPIQQQVCVSCQQDGNCVHCHGICWLWQAKAQTKTQTSCSTRNRGSSSTSTSNNSNNSECGVSVSATIIGSTCQEETQSSTPSYDCRCCW